MTNRSVEHANADPDHDQIAALAYQLWLDRGSPTGSAAIDWFRAEAELRNQDQSVRQDAHGPNEARIPYGIKEAGITQPV